MVKRTKIKFLLCALAIVIIVVSCLLALHYRRIPESQPLYQAEYVTVEGQFLNTNEGFYFTASDNNPMFEGKPIVKMSAADKTVDFNCFKSGDRIFIKILTIGELDPPVMDVYQVNLQKSGSIDEIDKNIGAIMEKYGLSVQ